MSIAATGAARSQYRYDAQARLNENGEIQHLHSAKRNVVEIGVAVVDAINPVNNFVAGFKEIGEMYASGGFGALMAILAFLPMLFISAVQEVIDIAKLPFRIVKDTTDTAYHLGAAALNGRDEGTAQPRERASRQWWETAPTFTLKEPNGTNGVSLSKTGSR